LAAIVAADVVGYSRMMSVDELGTLEALRSCRSEVIDPLIDSSGGRIVKTMGDGLLLEFASVVVATRFAVAAQRSMVERSSAMPSDSAIRFRIGIHIGDVIIDGDDIFGDGVNIAARVEPLAWPDGVTISDDAYRQVRDRLDVEWVDGGEHQVKNIARPLHVWHWRHDAAADEPPTREPVEVRELTQPTIAILPFDNMSGDPDQEFFADGMTEDLITDLSKLSGMFVVSRTTSSTFRGQSVDLGEIARQLGVRYILEGSVRKAGQRVRINVKLTDVEGPGHLWAERYDGTVENVFELQDDVGAKVVSALSVRISADEGERLQRVHTHNLEAYEVYVQAKATPYPPVPDRIEAAREMFERVVEMDPLFAGGYAGLAVILGLGGLLGHGGIGATAGLATDLARKAIDVDDSFGWGYSALSLALLMQAHHDDAIAAAEEAIRRQPNDADAHAYRGLIVALAGDPVAGAAAIMQGIRLNPRFINGPYLNLLTLTRFLAGDHAGAIDAFEENVGRKGPVGPPALAWAGGAYEGLGNHDRARALTADAVAQLPTFRLTTWNLLKLTRHSHQRLRTHDLMRSAGIPE
jgi:adenylate cyclase